MTRKIPIALMLPSLTLLAASLQADEMTAPPVPQEPPALAKPAAEKPAVEKPAAETPAAKTAENEVPAEGARVTTALVTPRLFLFDYFDGVGEDQTQFLERYDYREGFSDDIRSDVFVDLDLDVTVREGERDLFILERRGFGQHNHRGTAEYNDEKLGIYGNYSHYRSATGGIDYLFSPGQVAGGIMTGPGGLGDGLGPYRNFNDDAGPYNYHIDRTTYGAGFKIKPAALDDQATLAVDYQGYSRNGDKFAPFFFGELGGGGGDGTGQQRWRGTRLDVDEKMNRVGLTVSGSPNKLFEVAYEVSFEEFDNRSSELQVERDIMDPAGVTLPAGATTNERIASVLYMPDSQLVNHGIRASKTFNNRVVVSAGYGASWLKQDSFSELELVSGHTKGEIASENAYLTANALVSSSVSVEGHIKYSNRDNDSTYPDTLVSTTAAPRIDRINSLDYGASANWRPGFLGSNLTLGWRRLDIERDLTTGLIQPPQSLYREDTLSDEVYLKWTARPAVGWNLRVTPSFTWADETGLVTEPEEMFKLKSMLSYAAPEGWVVSGFYDYTDKQNGNNSFTDDVGGLTYNQEIDSTLQSAGLSLNVSPHENVNTYANLYWMQDDFSSYLIRSSVARWIPGVVFTPVDAPNYKIDSYVFNLGADWQYSDKLKLDGSYTFSKSTGDVASGAIQASLVAATGTIDSIIDNTLHSFALGADYLLNDRATLRVNYFYDRYEDDAYDLLSGGVHMMAVGVSYAM
jgi:hypothetical protein